MNGDHENGSYASAQRSLPRLPSAPPPEEKSKEEIEEEERQFERIKRKLAEEKSREGTSATVSASSPSPPLDLKTLPRLPSTLPPPKSKEEIEREEQEFEMIKHKMRPASPQRMLSGSFKNIMHHLPRLPSSLPPPKSKEEIEREEQEFEKLKQKASPQPPSSPRRVLSTSFQNAIHHLPRLPSAIPPPKSKEEREREIEEFDRLKAKHAAMRDHGTSNRISMSLRHMVSGLPGLQSSEKSFVISKEELEREAAEFEQHKRHHEENEHDEAIAREEEERNSKIRAQREANDKKEEEEELKKYGTHAQDTSCCGSMKRRVVRARRGFVREIKERHGIERLLLCAVAVALVWLTSLRFCRDIVGTFIIGPQLDAVVHSASLAVNRTVEERERYLSCSNRRVDRCNATFVRELDAEVQRVKLIMASNRAKLDSYSAIRDSASENFGYTVSTLDYLQTTLNDDIRDYGTSQWDTNPVCDQVKDFVKEQSAAKEASKDANSFKSAADKAVEDLLNQIDARQEYDRNYIANKLGGLNAIGINLGNYVETPNVNFNRLQASRDKLLACTTSVTGTYNGQTCNGQSLAYRMNSYKNTVTNAYQSAYDATSTVIDNALEDFSGLKGFYDSFTTEVKKYTNLINAIADALPSGVGVGDLSYNVNLDTKIPSFANVNFQTPGSVSTNFNLNPINTNLDTDASGVSNTLAQQRDAAIANAEAIRARQKAWQEKFFADYNPPAVGVNTTRSSWYSTSDSFIPNVNTNLGLLSTRVETPEAPDITISSNSTQSSQTATTLISSLDPRKIELYVYDDISVSDIMKAFSTIEGLALNFDYIYRVMRSVQVMRKYWRISEVATPPADVRISATKGAKLTQASYKTPIQKIGDLITHPIVLFTLFIVVIAFVVIAFLAFYMPIYNAYTAGCTHNTYTGAGTVITRNVNTLAFHYGASAGDSVADTEIDRQNVVRELECEKNTQQTYDVLIQNLDEYKFYQNKLQELSDKNAPFQICVNTTKIDKKYPLIAYNATHGNATSMHSTVFHSSFNATLAPLNPSLFDCLNITLCQVECTGPNNVTIQSSTFNAGCNVEWYLHANVLGFFLALLVFVLLNVSRGIFMRGLVHVLWRNVAIPKFSYIGSCYETGQLIFPKAVTDEGKTMKEAIRVALKQSLKKLTFLGYMLITTAVVINLPWIVLLYLLSKDLIFIPVEG